MAQEKALTDILSLENFPSPCNTKVSVILIH